MPNILEYDGPQDDELDEVLGYIAQVANSEQLSIITKALLAKAEYFNTMHKGQFRVGNEVEFPTRDGVTVRGTITKINRKNIVVDTPAQHFYGKMKWNVYPKFLSKVVSDA